jgi:uncharacterized cofD-like protein
VTAAGEDRRPTGGPHVVALGGGHGQAATLRAARRYAGHVTAVVSVADDGGSSGRLRRQLGIVPPGDLRTCLVALAEEGSVLAQAFEQRFDGGELVGHALGNLVLAGLVEAAGSVQGGLDEAGRLLGAVGRVLPAACEPVVLKAVADGGEIEGQSVVALTPHIHRVSLVPDDPGAPDEAVAALAEADQIVIGPGSLFTSVLAAAIVPGIATALREARAPRIYVANLRPQRAETDGYDVADHVAALAAHGIEVDRVLADPGAIALGELSLPVTVRPLAKTNGLAHDPAKLAEALSGLVG